MTRWSSTSWRGWVRVCAVLPSLLAAGDVAAGQGADDHGPPAASTPSPSRGRLQRLFGGLMEWPRPVRDDAVRPAQRAVAEAPTVDATDEGLPVREAPSPARLGPVELPDLNVPAAARSLGAGGPTTETLAAEDVGQGNTPEAEKLKYLQDMLGFDSAEDPVKVFGWLQNSFTGNANGRPRDGENIGVNPNERANAWQLNQFYHVIENPIEQGDDANLGFRVDLMMGQDWQFNYMQGLFNRAFPLNWPAGFDIPQLYGEAHFPFLTEGGIDVKGGRFYAIAGYEQVAAVSRPLLSVPYMFNYGQPFTHVGFLTTLHLTDRINIYNGSINGWDRWINQRYIWGYHGGFSWTSKDARSTLSSTLIWGPNQFPNFLPADQQLYPNGYVNIPSLAGLPNPGYARNDRTLFATVATREWSDKLTQVVEADQAWERAVPGLGSGGRNGAPRDATWFSFGNWFLYEFHPKFTGVWRSEIFWDPQGDRLQHLVNGQFVGDRYHEITLGAIWKPNPNLWVRPEARYDWSQFHPVYNDGTRKSQLTLAFDVIVLW